MVKVRTLNGIELKSTCCPFCEYAKDCPKRNGFEHLIELAWGTMDKSENLSVVPTINIAVTCDTYKEMEA